MQNHGVRRIRGLNDFHIIYNDSSPICPVPAAYEGEKPLPSCNFIHAEHVHREMLNIQAGREGALHPEDKHGRPK